MDFRVQRLWSFMALLAAGACLASAALAALMSSWYFAISFWSEPARGFVIVFAPLLMFYAPLLLLLLLGADRSPEAVARGDLDHLLSLKRRLGFPRGRRGGGRAGRFSLVAGRTLEVDLAPPHSTEDVLERLLRLKRHRA